MPEKILELLEKNSLTESQIAQKLNLSVYELKAALEYLSKMGYIRSVHVTPSSGCDGNCSGCSGCGSHSATGYTIWKIKK